MINCEGGLKAVSCQNSVNGGLFAFAGALAEGRPVTAVGKFLVSQLSTFAIIIPCFSYSFCDMCRSVVFFLML